MKTDLCDPCLADGVLKPGGARYGYRGQARIGLCPGHAAEVRADRRATLRVWTADHVREIADRAALKLSDLSGRAPPESRVPTVARVSDLEAFKRLSTELGASLTQIDPCPSLDGKPRPAFRAWASDHRGGCGEPGCGCSPGLWVSGAGSDGNGVTAHFGSVVRRGEDSDWTDADRRNWERLVRASGAVS